MENPEKLSNSINKNIENHKREEIVKKVTLSKKLLKNSDIAEKSPKDRSEKIEANILRFPFLLIPSSYFVTFLLIIAKTCLILMLSLFATI